MYSCLLYTSQGELKITNDRPPVSTREEDEFVQLALQVNRDLFGRASVPGLSLIHILPSEVMKRGISKSFPKLSFTITVKGGCSMEFRIEEKPAFYLVGVSKRVPMQFEGINMEIVKLAESITEEQKEEMHSLQNMEPYEIVNASYEADYHFLKEEGYLTHMIGVLTTEDQVLSLIHI